MRRNTTCFPNPSLGGGGAPVALAAAFDAASARRLRRVALRITRDPSAADDVVQAAFEKALRHAAGFRGEARPSTWLHRIVVNEALMWHRGEARRRTQLARAAAAARFDAEPAGADALGELLARERREQLACALATLPPEDADLLARCTLGEEGYGAWARERGLHPTAAKTRAFRARRALRTALEKAAGRRDSVRARLAVRPRVRAQQQPPSSHGPRVSR
jgi:RNA polymerase sigma-70 factor (ECF subfamily)